jgi:hypothetical protein
MLKDNLPSTRERLRRNGREKTELQNCRPGAILNCSSRLSVCFPVGDLMTSEQYARVPKLCLI